MAVELLQVAAAIMFFLIWILAGDIAVAGHRVR
jgi:hypothetical protein